MQQATLSFFWSERQYSGGEYIEAIKESLRRLNQISERFANMLVLGETPEETHPLDSELRNANDLILSALPRDWAYRSPEGELTAPNTSCYTPAGFANTFVTSLNYSDDHAVLEICAGSSKFDDQSSAILKLRGQSWLAPDLLKGVFTATLDSWHPWYACCQIESPHSPSPYQPLSEIPVGWLTFIRNDQVELAVPKHFNSRAHDNGVLIELPLSKGDQIASPNREIQELRAALDAAGLLADPIL